MDQNHNAVMLYFCFAMAITMVSAEVLATEGQTIRITCNVTGTLPRWTKDVSKTITIEGNSMISSFFSARFSYADDQKTLIVNSVQLSDAGSYLCSIGGVYWTLNVVVSTSTPTTTTAGPTYNDEKLLTNDEMIILIVVSCIIGVILILAAVIGIAANAQRKRIKHRWSRRSSHGERRGHPMYHQDHLSERDLYDQDDIVYPYTTHQFGIPNRPYINQYIDDDDDDMYNRYQEIYHPYKEYYHPYDRKREPPHAHGSRHSHVTGDQMRKPQGHRDRHERRETHGLYPYTSYNRTYTQNSGELFYYGYCHNQSTNK